MSAKQIPTLKQPYTSHRFSSDPKASFEALHFFHGYLQIPTPFFHPQLIQFVKNKRFPGKEKR